MNKFRGKINVNGTISYVPQQGKLMKCSFYRSSFIFFAYSYTHTKAWIQNATVKDNIIFGKSFSKQLYDQVVTCCALKPDFNILG